jgi:hypothetical protein
MRRERDRVRPPDVELAHMADVEQSAALADGGVLRGDTARILNRHQIPREGHHLRAERDVPVR